jgi:ubiquinone biosynthesis protein
VLRKIYRMYRDWDRLIDILPRDVTEILRRIRNGTFEMKHEHQRLESTVNRLVHGILSASFFVGSSLMLAHDVEPAPWNISIPGTFGLLVSIFLAWRLMRRINKSEESDKTK